MKIETELNWTEDDLDSAVMDAVASRLTEQLRERLDEKINREFDAALKDQIHARVAEIVEHTITESTPMTNRFGEPTGKTATLRELIVDETQTFLSARRDDRFAKQKGIQLIVHEAVGRTFEAELKKEVEAAQAKVRKAIESKGAEFLADAVVKLR